MKTPQRDDRGRFQLGTAGGPGRPARATETAYLAVVTAECSLDAWRLVVARAVADAQAGCDRARAWLSQFLIGSPSNKAPTPSAVIVEGLLNRDPPLEDAAKVLAMREMNRELFPILHQDLDRLAQLEEEAAAFIIATEANNEP